MRPGEAKVEVTGGVVHLPDGSEVDVVTLGSPRTAFAVVPLAGGWPLGVWDRRADAESHRLRMAATDDEYDRRYGFPTKAAEDRYRIEEFPINAPNH